ncbi:hypothetical protein [Ralstonia phage RP31]|uniref:Uncharacterized protein n=2 Tax=Ripduovirus RP12 TaxID=2560700 RepID=A0A1L7N1M0_9CAUD|nr:hypothetical protein FDH28_gp231 [Ralstonia phage RP12]BAW19164.1 hypothetical protein [Ralstonia phage RP12]BAW19450.1 hypothetical protein [Ralstonia phage RP31]
MIKHYYTRTFDDARGVMVCEDRQMTPQAALKYFVRAEVYYGSKMVFVSEDEVRTKSGCFGAVDDMVFSGSKEDLAEIYEIARFLVDDTNAETASYNFHHSKDQKFNKMASEFMTDILSARRPWSAAIWHMLVRKEGLPNKDMRMIDVETAFEMIYCDGYDPKSVFELAGIECAAVES